MKKYITVLVLLSVVLLHDHSFTQCSDAGVCTIGERNNKLNYNSSVLLQYSLGNSGETTTGSRNDNDITYHEISVDIALKPFENSILNITAPYRISKGVLGTASGFGDVMLLWSQLFDIKKQQSFSISAGVKLSTGNSNTGDSLPQSYQPGTGTTDILFGIGYNFSTFFAAAGFQKTLGKSKNLNEYKKGDDIMLRAGWTDRFNKLNVKAEVITIKRLNKSEMLDNRVPVFNTAVEIEDSDFIQVNLLGQVTFNINDKFHMIGFGAIPLLKRSENSDGSRRAYTIGAGINYLFNYAE